MDVAYGARYAELYRRHWWWRSREEYLQRVLDRLVPPGSAGDVLDFGCGDGLFFPVLRKYGEPWGIEPDVSLLDPRSEWRHRIRPDLSEPDGGEPRRYGLIVALDVLEHLQDPTSAVRDLGRRLRPRGWFLATVPAFQSQWTGHDDLNHHRKRYRLAELEQLVASAGLELHDSRYFFVGLAVAKWAVALKERLSHADLAPPEVPAAMINRLLYTTCRLEQRLLGVSRPPFGSSALVVARARDTGSG